MTISHSRRTKSLKAKTSHRRPLELERLEARELLSITQLTNTPGDHRWPSLNNHGDYVYSAKDSDGLWQIFNDGQPLTSGPFNKEYPSISDDGTVVYFQDGGSGGNGWQVIRRSPGGGVGTVEFSSRNNLSGAHRDANQYSGIASNGTSITGFNFYSFGGTFGSPTQRFNVSGVGQLPPDFGGSYNYPDINAHGDILLASTGGFFSSPAIYKTTISGPFPGTLVTSATMGRINDSGDIVTVTGDLKSPGTIRILSGPAYSQTTNVSSGSWADIDNNKDVIFEAPDTNGVRQIFLFTGKPDIQAISAQLASPTSVTFQYTTSGNPGPFTVALYRSGNTTFEPGTDTLVQYTTVTPSPTNPQAPVVLSTDPIPIQYDPALPYLLAVADPPTIGNPNGQIDESNENNNTAVLHLPPPNVKIDINGTTTDADDIMLFNPGVYSQSIQAMLTNQGSLAGTFQIDVSPAGAASLDQSTINLASGASTTITITPLAASSAANDVKISAKFGNYVASSNDMTIVSIGLPQHIRNADTPASMADRIPPRVDTPLNISVTPDLGGSGQFVTLVIEGQGGNDGTASINSSFSQESRYDIFSTSTVEFGGGTQTTRGGYSSNLHLVAQVRGQDTVQTAGFSVSAIPINFRQTSVQAQAGGVLHFDYAWSSDSGPGNIGDLDQVWMGEYVTYPNGGVIAGPGHPWLGNFPSPTITPSRATFLWGSLGVFPVGDTHSPPGRSLPTAGPADSVSATQYYGFHDFRSDNRPDDNSADWQINLTGPIAIDRFVENLGTAAAPQWQYRITKSGATNTALLTIRPRSGPSTASAGGRALDTLSPLTVASPIENPENRADPMKDRSFNSRVGQLSPSRTTDARFVESTRMALMPRVCLQVAQVDLKARYLSLA